MILPFLFRQFNFRFTLLAVAESPSKKINQKMSQLISQIKSGVQTLQKSENFEVISKDLNFDITEFLASDPANIENKGKSLLIVYHFSGCLNNKQRRPISLFCCIIYSIRTTFDFTISMNI